MKRRSCKAGRAGFFSYPSGVARRSSGRCILVLAIGAVAAPAAAVDQDFSGDQVATGVLRAGGDSGVDTIRFSGPSSAGDSSIAIDLQGSVIFQDDSTAASASIDVNAGGYLSFEENSSTGNASIRVGDGGYAYFYGAANGGNASVSVIDEGVVMLLGGATTMGSLEGSGAVSFSGELGTQSLRVGGNGNSTSFTGVIWGGFAESTELIKTGSGVFTLDVSGGYFKSAIIVEQGLIEFSSNEGLGGDPDDPAGDGRISLNGGGLRWAAGTSTDISHRLEPLGANGGIFDTNGNDVVLQAGISGSGALTKTGDGTLTLGAASYSGGTIVEGGTLAGALPTGTAYTINGGSLGLGGPLTMTSLSGSGGTLALGGATLAVDQAGDTVYGGQISGAGGLVKTGAGRLDLTGASTFSGTVDIAGGTLAVNGSLGPSSIVNVGSGGALGGNGTLGSVNVADGGSLAPGNSIGTLHLTGDLILQPGSIYVVETDAAGNADRVVVDGLVSLAGTVQVLAGSGEYAASTNYEIITATGSSPISGTFSAVTSNLAFLDPSLSYAPNGVTLTLTRNDVGFADVPGLTPNQQAVCGSLDTLGTDNAVYRTVLNQSGSGVAGTCSQLSGDAHSTMSAALLYSELDAMNAPLGNLRSNLDAPLAALPMWAQATTGRQRIDGDGNGASATQDFDGVLVGGDLPAFGDWRVGAAVGYDIAQLRVGSRSAEGDTTSKRFALYGGRGIDLANGDSLRIFAGAAYSLQQLDSVREVALIDGPERLTRSYEVATIQLFGELAYRFNVGDAAHLEPFAGLMKVDQRVDAFQERGGSAALTGERQHNELFVTTAGVRGRKLATLGGVELDWKGSLTWRHLDGDVRPELGLRLSGGERYTVLGTELPRDSLLLSIDAEYDLYAGVVLKVGANGMASERGNAAALVANLRWKMP